MLDVSYFNNLYFLSPAGSFPSVSPVGSFTSRYPQTGIYLDGFEAPSSPRCGYTDPITANMGGPVTFEAPELPEETLMEVRSRGPSDKGIIAEGPVCCAVTPFGNIKMEK